MSSTLKKRIRLFLTALFFGYSVFKTFKVLSGLITGSSEAGQTAADGGMLSVVFYLVLYLALPLHLTCVGLLMQRPYFPAPWPRIALLAVVFSGVWLGISFAIRKFG